MKKCILFLIPMLVAGIVSAQEETLTGQGIESGGDGGLVYKLSSFNGETGMLSGGRGGWIINHGFAVGGGRYHLMHDVQTNPTDPQPITCI